MRTLGKPDCFVWLAFGWFLCTCINLPGQTLLNGAVRGSDGVPLAGATVVVSETKSFTTTDADGLFSIQVQNGQHVEVSFLGYTPYMFTYENQSYLEITLLQVSTLLDEVVITGYGEQARKDLTGSIGSVKEKDFNKGQFTSPDQLIQGRVAGVQISNTSGQPGVAATIKIRGNSVITGTGQPLFVVDGVPLSGVSPRSVTNDFGTTSPNGNPLNFLNPSDIASIDVLKDASAAAIYGSRAAYGVVMITTKKAVTGEPKIDFSLTAGVASIQKEIEILDAEQYREAIEYYDSNPQLDKGGSSDGLGSILRKGVQQNYDIGITGGNNNAKYRFSFGYYDQEGILNKSELKKYSTGISGNFKFLDSKRLGLDVNLIASQFQESIPFIRNGISIVGDALMWNPTDPFRKPDGSWNIYQDIRNPLALSEMYNDNSKVSTVLASLAPYYEFTDWLIFKTLISVNYSSGVRRTSLQQGFVPVDFNPAKWGTANIYNNETYTNQITNTLTFHKDLIPGLNLTVIAGFEYQKFSNKGSSVGVFGPQGIGFGNFGLDYTNYIQYSNTSNRSVNSFSDPIVELQSYFGRAIINYKSKYLLTVTFRADGSSKFGAENKYGYFPSLSAAWIMSSEDFFKLDFINYLKFRVGWGKTGNQEFPAGSSVALYGFKNNGGIGQVNNPNPDLKWQADEQFNAGIDLTFLNNKVNATVDYFRKITTDLLYPSYPVQPAPPGTVVTWINLDGEIQNSGLEVTVNATLLDRNSFTWNLGFNTSFLKNQVSGLTSPILTGALHGPGTSGTTVQEIRNGAPMNSFFTRKYLGINPADGLSQYEDNGNTFYNVGNPNPTTLLGINTTLQYKKVSLTAYLYGAFGHSIYNNTLNTTLNVGNIETGKNMALSVYENPIKESPANPSTPSSRYIEKGDYLRMGNATLTYHAGNIGKAFKQMNIYITGQNIFTLTNYSGFNPEVNIDKSVNGVPSLGIDYQAYPAARTILLGINFSLQ